MEAYEESDGQFIPTPVDFSRFVKNVELNCEKNLLSRQNQLLLRKKIKENWMIKSKIMPPGFKQLGNQNIPPVPSNKFPLTIASFHDYRKTTPLVESEGEHKRGQSSCQNKNQMPREECKTSHAILRSAPSCERLKANWKLQFRRDQLNVLKYMRQEEGLIQPQTIPSQKQFKVRKIQKKFEQLRPQTLQLYKSNLDKIKQSRTPSPKVRYRTVGCTRS